MTCAMWRSVRTMFSDILFTSGTTGRRQGRDDRPPPVPSPLALGLGRVRSAGRVMIVIWWSISSSTASVYKAGILACLVSGAALVPQLVYARGAGHGPGGRTSRSPCSPARQPSTRPSSIIRAGRPAAWSSLRLAVTGAAPVPVALVERYAAGAELRGGTHGLRP